MSGVKVLKVYRSKSEWICRFLPGKRVLDLGCVDHDLDQSDHEWLHESICECAESVLGVDCLEDQVEQMRRRGYTAVCGDVEEMNLGELFDVIVAGDIIEHLANPGRFFERVAAHLKPDGLLLVSTPNPFFLPRFCAVMLKGRCYVNEEHVAWYESVVLRQLARRHGFIAIDEAYVDNPTYYLSSPKIDQRLSSFRQRTWRIRSFIKNLAYRTWLIGASTIYAFRPQLAETLCIALKKVSCADDVT